MVRLTDLECHAANAVMKYTLDGNVRSHHYSQALLTKIYLCTVTLVTSADAQTTIRSFLNLKRSVDCTIY